MSKFRVGDTAYIVESNNLVREVTIKRCSGGFYLVQFENSGGIKVREKRLFQTKEDAIAIKYAVCSGVKGIFTMHGSDLKDIKANKEICELIENKWIEKIIFI